MWLEFPQPLMGPADYGHVICISIPLCRSFSWCEEEEMLESIDRISRIYINSHIRATEREQPDNCSLVRRGNSAAWPAAKTPTSPDILDEEGATRILKSSIDVSHS
jgi:hypothetical protein